MLANLTNKGGKEEPLSLNPLVLAGAGLPVLPKKIVERILTNEYVDFSELPPAKGKVRSLPSGLEGQVVLIQAVDLEKVCGYAWAMVWAIFCGFQHKRSALPPMQSDKAPQVYWYFKK